MHDEGYIDLTELGTIEDKYYHIKDHLGNVRAVIREDIAGEPDVMQAKTYYPFGMVFTSEMMQGAIADKTNPYLYNTKEQQEMPGLWFDFNFRYYDPQIARFTGVDPIAEDFNWVSPYNYAENNPASGIDLWGLQFVPHYEQKFFDDGLRHAGFTEKQISVNQRKRGKAGIGAGAILFLGLGAAATSEIWIPIVVEGGIDFLTAVKLTPEMLKYIAIRYPTLHAYLVAALNEATAPPGTLPSSTMTKEEYFLNWLKILLKLQGDSRDSEDGTENKNDNNNKNDNESSDNTSNDNNKKSKNETQNDNKETDIKPNKKKEKEENNKN